MDLRGHFLSSASQLLACVPGVRDGDPVAIHDARVATRRMRAVMPVVSICYPHVDLSSEERTVTRVGRALGRVRDLDVADDLISALERRAPSAAARAAEVRRAIVVRQQKERRRLVKELDRLPIEDLASLQSRLRGSARPGWRTSRAASDGPIRTALGEQAVALRTAIEHASGIYFPNRAHGVRIDAKKLRYSLEMTGDPEAIAPNGLKRLRRAQELLGALHDREVVRAQLVLTAGGGDDAGFAAAEAALDADCEELFARYASRRAGLVQVCDSVDRFANARRAGGFASGRWLRIAAVAVPVAAAAIAAGRKPRALLGR